MLTRREIGAWLEGPKAAAGVSDDYVPGERLGAPASGRGSIARLPRRLAAVCIDWFLCTVLAWAAFGVLPWSTQGNDALYPLGIFFAANVILLPLAGTTVGHRIMSLQVVGLGGSHRVGILNSIVRAALLCLFIPAVMWDKDGRGVHDKAARTAILNTR